MRWYVAVLWTVFFLPGVLHAQTYHIYRPVSNAQSEKKTVIESSPWLEIYGDGVYSSGRIKDGNDRTISENMLGGRAGLRVGIGYNIMLGAEGEKVKASDQRTDLISTFARESWQATVKWTFTPNIEPKMYVIAGIGRVKQDAHLRLGPGKQFQGDTTMWSLGLGGEMVLYKGLHTALEYRMMCDTKRWESFVFTAPRMRHEFSVGLRYHF